MPLSFPGRWFWPGVALAVGIAGICAIWVAIAMLSGASASWLGLVAAVDMALLLRLTRAPEGIARNVAAALATLAATALSQWLGKPRRLERQAGMTLAAMLADLPTACSTGIKRNAKGHNVSWIGYKLHIDTAGAQHRRQAAR